MVGWMERWMKDARMHGSVVGEQWLGLQTTMGMESKWVRVEPHKLRLDRRVGMGAAEQRARKNGTTTQIVTRKIEQTIHKRRAQQRAIIGNF
jgi:hypothetical protein